MLWKVELRRCGLQFEPLLIVASSEMERKLDSLFMIDENARELEEEVRNLENLWFFNDAEKCPGDRITGDFLVTLYLRRFVPYWFKLLGWIGLTAALQVLASKTNGWYVEGAALLTQVMFFFSIGATLGETGPKLVRTFFGPLEFGTRRFKVIHFGSIFFAILLWLFIIQPGMLSIVDAFRGGGTSL